MPDSENSIPSECFNRGLFREPARAQQDWERIRAHAPGGLAPAALDLLAESPDPDQALGLLERLIAESSDELPRLLDQDRVLLHHAVVLFGHSYWLGETLVQRPDILYSLQREKNLERSLGREDFREGLAHARSRSLETDVSLFLARFKKCEYVRITLRDLLGIATLAETTAELSALADVLIEEALRDAEAQMRARYGSPQYQDAHGRPVEAPFAVLSLGKLGGNELNYSSDVDLLYIFADQESSSAPSLREYFIRQSQLITEVLSRATPEGDVFRIDLRLRPQGHEGEPAVGLRYALNYYAQAAQDWELQAMIKVRHSAGDISLARDFIRGVQRHVYTESLNFEAVETAVNSRRKIGAFRRHSMAASKARTAIDVKLDRGGIRDIEFLVQCLQRVYGGKEKWLRSGGTLFSLQKLHDKGHLSSQDLHGLTLAYEFLRKVEHRLQLQRGRQVHRLPATGEEVQVLDRAVAGGPISGREINPSASHRHERNDDVAGFLRSLETHMSRVAEVYERIIHRQQQREQTGIAPAAHAPASGGAVREMSFDQILDRIAADSPALHRIVTRGDLSLHARRGLHRFLASAMTSVSRYAALLENPESVGRATSLFETSDYLTDILVRHPDVIRELDPLAGADGKVRTGPDHVEHFSSREKLPNQNEALAQLRRSFRQRGFVVGAQDILSPRPAFESMRESTRIGEAAIRHVLGIVQGDPSLAVFALGRMGTEEFDIASDADLLFVRTPEAEEDEARMDAQRMVHALAAYTKEGTMFAVDARLRPHGGQGELVVSPAQVEKYLAEEAQPWEALSYSKLRFVAGRADVAAWMLPLAWWRIVETGSRPGFSQEVVQMRTRLEKSNRFQNSFKLARGGFYDIDFIASYLMLREALLKDGNTGERLQHLHDNGALPSQEFEQLHRGALLYRTVDHVIRLVTGRARPELPEAEHARHAVEDLVNRILGRQDGQDLQEELRETQERVRQIFMQVIRG